jgi:hypothetical protein
MVATTTPLTTLLSRLQADFSGYTFVQGGTFRWSPAIKTITYIKIDEPADAWTLIHELAHAELGHVDYSFDVDLIKQEVAAWQHARDALATAYGLSVPDDFIEDSLDSYRSWLHKRSLCPDCGQNGLQTTQNTYSCINCRCLWRVNDARVGRLRRVKITQQSF